MPIYRNCWLIQNMLKTISILKHTDLHFHELIVLGIKSVQSIVTINIVFRNVTVSSYYF